MDYTELPPEQHPRLVWPELPDIMFEDQTQSADLEVGSRLHKVGQFVRYHIAGITAGSLFLTAAGITANYEIESHTAVTNDVVALPANEVPNILDSSVEAPAAAAVAMPSSSPNSSASESAPVAASTAPATSIATTPITKKTAPASTTKIQVPATTVKNTTSTHETSAAIPTLEGTAPQQLIIPTLHINRPILPVDTAVVPGEKNSMGGPVYGEVDFPVDKNARYWVEGGLPNTVKNPDLSTQQHDALRTIIYGHASDLGHNLLFQNLQGLHIGQTFTLNTDGYAFTYTVYSESNPSKDGLADDSQVYGYPANGRKEAALVACLPHSNSHSVRIGYLSSVEKLNTSNK